MSKSSAEYAPETPDQKAKGSATSHNMYEKGERAGTIAKPAALFEDRNGDTFPPYTHHFGAARR
jgi:hypothetical protein